MNGSVEFMPYLTLSFSKSSPDNTGSGDQNFPSLVKKNCPLAYATIYS